MDVIFQLSETDPTALRVTVAEVGADLLVVVDGGDRPHIGAVSIGIPHPSMHDLQETSSTVSVFNLTGHRDDRVSSPLAREIAREFGRTTVAVAGIHIDEADDDAVNGVLARMKDMRGDVIAGIRDKLNL
jgi:hypothetical protein